MVHVERMTLVFVGIKDVDSDVAHHECDKECH